MCTYVVAAIDSETRSQKSRSEIFSSWAEFWRFKVHERELSRLTVANWLSVCMVMDRLGELLLADAYEMVAER